MVEKKLSAKYALLQGVYWMLAAIALAYMTPILEAKGFTSFQIGILNFVKYVSVIVFQIWIGNFSDRHAKTISLKLIIGVLVMLCVITSYVFWVVKISMVGAVIIMLLLGATVNCVSPLIDSLSIQYMNHGRKMNYTISRATGSFTYATFCIFLGVFADRCGVTNLLILQVAMALLLLVVNLWMDKVDWSYVQENEEAAKTESNDESAFLDDESVHKLDYLFVHFPKYVMFLIGCMLIFMGFNLNCTFMIDWVMELGGSHKDYGMAEFVLSFSEIPFALLFYQIVKHIKIDKMMVLCGLFCTLRAAATTFAPNITVLILSQALEICGLAIFYAGSVYFVMENLPKGDVVKGVSLINVFALGVGEAISSLLSGYIRTNLGIYPLMVVSVFVSALSVIAMLVMIRTPKYKKGHNCEMKQGGRIYV